MIYVNGPNPSKRKMLLSTAQSIMLYGAEIFADVLSKEYRRKPLLDVQINGALGIASCYRTVSADATLIIAGVIPIDLLAIERKLIYTRKHETDKKKMKREA